MALRILIATFIVGIAGSTAVADDGRRGNGGGPGGGGSGSGRGGGGGGWNGGSGGGGSNGSGWRHRHNCTPSFNFGVVYTSPYWGYPSYYDPFLAEQNQMALEFQRQQLRQETERALQADAEARAAAAEKAAAVREETRRKKSAAAAKLAARNFTSGNYRNAAVNYQEAASLAPTDASSLMMLAQSQFAMKRYFDAAKSLRAAVKLNPNMVGLDVTSLYGNGAEFRQQMTSLADELRTNPHNGDAMLLLGHMLYASGQKANAKTIFLECAKLGVDADALKPYLDSYETPVASIP